MENIKEYHEKYNSIPSYNGLNEKILGDLKGVNETQTRLFLDTVDNIKTLPQDNTEEQTKAQAMNFCKQQVLKKALKEVDVISSNGDFENYHKIEAIIQKALQVGQNTDDIQNVFENIKDALKEDSRLPIPTGIIGIDNLLNGGLGRGELGVVLAPTGTGKTTLLTKFANTAYNQGFNVVQIFFEDNPGNIKRKHYTIWSEIAPDQQPEFRDTVKEKVEEAQAQVKIAEQKAAETSAKIEYKFIDKVKVVKDVQVIIQEKIVEKEKIIDSGCKVAPEALSILNEASKVPGGKK